ncbi:uncharacterized protein LOC124148958 [Haliotis rufescens]|uniref:uncharacterized protein LOC124148958 n=1 Tax=Haliotis rufescens TaxID=6454 RepID=UPI00201E9B58|nr:uncharacterized protein LOC124148958 [Haliotis rufescens]XP_046376210.2 uncharacterized protein LOC124148958 [Haliotis rufescens]
MGRKIRLPPLRPPSCSSPIYDPEARDPRRMCLPQILNIPLVATVQGQNNLGRRVRPATGSHHNPSVHCGNYLPQPLRRREPVPYTDNTQMPKDMLVRRPTNSQLDLTLPGINDGLSRRHVRLLRRQQMSRLTHCGNERVSPQGESVSSHHSPDAPHLAIHGQRIYTPFARSPGEGMEDPLSDVSSEEIFPIGGSDSTDSTTMPRLNLSEVPALNLPQIPRRSPRLLTPRLMAQDYAADDMRSPSPAALPYLPHIRKRKRRGATDDC